MKKPTNTLSIEKLDFNVTIKQQPVIQSFYVIKVLSWHETDPSFWKLIKGGNARYKSEISYYPIVFKTQEQAEEFLEYSEFSEYRCISYGLLLEFCTNILKQIYQTDNHTSKPCVNIELNKSNVREYLQYAGFDYSIDVYYTMDKMEYVIHVGERGWVRTVPDKVSPKLSSIKEIEKWVYDNIMCIRPAVQDTTKVAECYTSDDSLYICKVKPNELDKSRNEIIRQEIERSKNYIEFLTSLIK